MENKKLKTEEFHATVVNVFSENFNEKNEGRFDLISEFECYHEIDSPIAPVKFQILTDKVSLKKLLRMSWRNTSGVALKNIRMDIVASNNTTEWRINDVEFDVSENTSDLTGKYGLVIPDMAERCVLEITYVGLADGLYWDKSGEYFGFSVGAQSGIFLTDKDGNRIIETKNKTGIAEKKAKKSFAPLIFAAVGALVLFIGVFAAFGFGLLGGQKSPPPQTTTSDISTSISDTTKTSETTNGLVADTTSSTALTDPDYTTPVLGSWNYGYETTNRNNTAVNDGHLILVNNDHAYTFPASLKLVEMYGQSGFGTNYTLGIGTMYPDGTMKSLELSRDIVENLTAMLSDMKEANPTLTDTRRLMILSGYRTLEKQEELYANDPDSGLTAKPGHSEHHTGLTFDIRINVKDQTEIEYLNDAEQAWITANCAKYGFILRYTEDNKSITQIGGEDWHFRYVGVAHATYMVEHDLCLEEYIAFLKEKHTYGVNRPLTYSAEGTDYTIYYFPASVENDNTDIYVPSSGHYEISGNNVDGFIVTVTHESN